MPVIDRKASELKHFCTNKNRFISFLNVLLKESAVKRDILELVESNSNTDSEELRHWNFEPDFSS